MLDMQENPWARLLAYVTGLINQELLLKNEWESHLPPSLRIRRAASLWASPRSMECEPQWRQEPVRSGTYSLSNVTPDGSRVC